MLALAKRFSRNLLLKYSDDVSKFEKSYLSLFQIQNNQTNHNIIKRIQSMRYSFLLLSLLVLNVSSLVPGKYFDRVFLIIFENQGYSDVINNSDFISFANQGLLLTNFIATQHPSQPNYINILAGDTMGVSDDNSHDITGTNIVDLLEAKGVSWKSYNENYPGNCYTGTKTGLYARKHTPFISFLDIQKNAARCKKIVAGSQLDSDLQDAQNLPQFMFFTPNMNDDGHNTDLPTAGSFLTSFFGSRLSQFPSNTLVIVTWDEGEGSDYDSNHIYTALVGSMIPKGSTDNTLYGMSSFTRLVEENWGLGSLGRGDVNANIMFPLKNKSFLE